MFLFILEVNFKIILIIYSQIIKIMSNFKTKLDVKNYVKLFVKEIVINLNFIKFVNFLMYLN